MIRGLAIVILLFFVSSVSDAAAVRSLCKINHPSDAEIEWECHAGERLSIKGHFCRSHIVIVIAVDYPYRIPFPMGKASPRYSPTR